MAAYLGLYVAEAFGGDDLLTFVVVDENDGIAGWITMERHM